MTNKIVRADGTTEITDFKSFTYVESTNSDEDIRPGGAYSARVEFEAYGAKTDAPSYGERLAYYQVFPDETETLIGYFYAEPVVATKATFQVTAYDAVKKLDTDFSTRLQSIQSSFPMTLSALVGQACDVAGVTVSGTIPQSTWSVGAFYADNITCRQIIGWAAEIACRYVRCNTSGNLVFDWYTSKSGYRVYPSAGTSSNSETYIPYKQDGLQYENYTVETVEAVAVQPPQMTGTGYVYPSSATDASNTLVIADNLLLTNNTDSTCTTLAQYIYNQMRSLPTYRPCTISTFPNESPLRAGDMVSVTDIQGVSFTTIITDFNASASAFKYGSKGNETYSKTYYNPVSRASSQSANSVTKAELAMTQESIISTVSTTYETKSDASSKLEEAKSYSESQIAQTSESILSTVSTTYETKTDATGKLNTAKSYTESQIAQFADSITLSVTNSGTSSTISISGDGITTQSKNIVFTGYVTFSNLSTSGQTTINGGNITTGTIQDANGNVVFNLSSGSLTIKSGAIYLGTPSNNVYPFQVTSSGVLTAKSGTVGGFTISDSAIYTAASSTTTSGSIYLSTSNFTRSINGTSRSLRLAIGSNFGVSPTGVLYATSAVISGSITATSLALGSGVSFPASSVSGLADVATSGSYTDLSNKPTIPDVTLYIQKDGTIGTISDGSNGFVVSSSGLLQASNATIYGTIYASAGTIGGWTINGSYGIYTNSKTTATSTRTGILIQKDGGIYAGAYSSATGACPFQVTSSGAITSTSGTIGGFTISSNAITSASEYLKLTSSGKIYCGEDDDGYQIAIQRSGILYKFDGTEIGRILPSFRTEDSYGLTLNASSTGYIGFSIASTTKMTIDSSSVTVSSGVSIGTSSTSYTLKLNNKNVLTSDDLSGYVPTTRTVNSKALSSNITLTASDVSALPLSGGTLTGNLTLSRGTVIYGQSSYGTRTVLYVDTYGNVCLGSNSAVTEIFSTAYFYVNIAGTRYKLNTSTGTFVTA